MVQARNSPCTRYEDDPDDERGLFFMCYQTSISNQFVFLQKLWANTHNRPTLAGHDFLIGQVESDENHRFGSMLLEGKKCPLSMNGRWITMTGGGYFSVPGIAGVKKILR
jgi:deferrochelatase/peroxidase EfeB